MQLCEGVLVILDKEATPFQRIWCCFEQATVAQGEKLLLDIATVQDGEPELLTDGSAYTDPDGNPETMYIKGEREKHFPVGLLEKAYAIEVEKGQASVEKDRKLILNSITETDPKAEPDPAHPAFGAINRFLRSQIIGRGAQQLADAGQREKVIEVVCADTGRETLALSLKGQKDLENLAALGEGVGKLPGLTSLKLNFEECEQLADDLRREFESKADFLAACEAGA